ncbi:MotA/TolQ/ExbB proton channel family protein [Veillonella magna]|uniref:MotA/TolQ/ExbB proton channel family protein n=1 Tax=Veillonella magna TaxID=464322 RepID=A0ABS2GHE6_9FIRM|nr:MotA/TolQ/ExbB proton channel family protein [Veillonella magna]MBM6825316.1 MotA/TolQ/ExbB proton channel family protein [Veillonella magna]MBM6913599.1 MotA/TolQ/ExbB proton channel family protein [Veillonella magna]
MELLAMFHQGGLVMYPLLLCSIIAVAILVERLRTYKKAKSNMAMLREEIPAHIHEREALLDICVRDGGVAAEMVYAGAEQGGTPEQQNQRMQSAAVTIAGRLRSYLNYLETIVTLAPLLGLLGTVTGMISSFNVLSVADGQPFAITAGVGEALIATATGLCVAIIALVIHTYLVQVQDKLITDMEEMGNVYIGALTGMPLMNDGEQVREVAGDVSAA